MPMLLPTPLSRFVHIEIQYRSLSVKRMHSPLKVLWGTHNAKKKFIVAVTSTF